MTVQANTKRQIMNSSSPDKPERSIDRTARFFCYAALWFAAQVPAAAQNSLSDAEADGIRAFLHENFRQTNACLVIGLADQRGNRIFSAGKLDNGTDRDVNGDTVFLSVQFPRRSRPCCCKTRSSAER